MKDIDSGIIVAPGAGFRPGVKKAIDCVLELEAAGKKPVYTIGPLIHNKQVTDTLEAKGITAIETLDAAIDKKGVLVIRAHGITPDFQKEVEARGMEVVDATCPLVKKVHKVIEEFASRGYDTVIVGDAGHAEVIGLLGYTRGRGRVVADAREAEALPNFEKVNIVAQTTQKEENFYKIADIIKAKAQNCQISNTICEPTKQRQKETIENAKTADLVIVVGGKHSANTARLAKLCGELCPKVIHVEDEREINRADIATPKKIFITAGASTPSWVIENVAGRVKELRKKTVSPLALLERAWGGVIKSSVYAAFAAVCLTYVCMQLQYARVEPGLLLLSWLFVFTLTNANKDFNDTGFKTLAIWRGVKAGGFAAACAVAFAQNIYVFVPTILILTLGMLYPLRRKLKSFTSFPGGKDIATTLGWVFVCVYVPAAAQGLLFAAKSVWLAFAYGMLLVFMRSVILSIATEYKDIILGKESFYKAFGLRVTKAAIIVIMLALTAVLLQLLLMGWKPKLTAMLLIGHAYTVAVAYYLYTRKIPRGAYGETLVDGQFFLLALLAYQAVNIL